MLVPEPAGVNAQPFEYQNQFEELFKLPAVIPILAGLPLHIVVLLENKVGVEAAWFTVIVILPQLPGGQPAPSPRA